MYCTLGLDVYRTGPAQLVMPPGWERDYLGRDLLCPTCALALLRLDGRTDGRTAVKEMDGRTDSRQGNGRTRISRQGIPYS